MADPNESQTQGPPYGYPPAADPTGARSLRDYWRVLVQRRWVIYTCLIAVVSVTMILTFFTIPIYEAVTTIQIERQGPDILTFKDVVSSDSSAYAYQDFYQTQYKILQSKSVVKIAVERLDLATRPEYLNRKPALLPRAVGSVLSFLRPGSASGQSVDPTETAVRFVQGGMSVRPIRNSQLVSIAFRDRNPELAREITDALAEAYVAFNYQNKYGTTELAREFLTKEVVQAQAELATLQRRLQDYGDKKKILAVADGAQDISEQALADLNRRYIEAKTRTAAAQARYENAVGAPPDSLPEVLNSPLIANLKQQYAEVERKYSQMTERFKEGWPPLMQLKQELQQAQARLQQETLGIASQVQSVTTAEYERARAEMSHLEAQVNSQKSEVQRVNRDAVDYTGLQAEIDSKRKILADLVARQTQTTSSERLKETSASNVRIVDGAELPRHPVSPRRTLNLAVALLLGMISGVGMALFLDHVDNSIKSEQDVAMNSGLPVLAHIPLFQSLQVVTEDGAPVNSSSQLDFASHNDSRSMLAEAFKSLRTSVLLSTPDRPPVRIMITSCEPQDGKSTASMNLAIVLAQLGRSVLLMDADLRRPRLHRAFNVSDAVGLSSVLTGNAEIERATFDTFVPGLRLLPSGPIPPNPSELLDSPGLENLLRALEKTGYDHILLDSPPMLSVTDPIVLASRSEVCLIVVRAGKTIREGLREAASRLQKARPRTVGAILNGVSDRAGHYYYRKYSYYRAQDGTADSSNSVGPLRARARSR
ncbi:MAG TPA: polysaccharide biosynthesis tyrosine autokinase [Candidatus Polarisedimenticolaceae bacterium]|nr:polysaccharide biosynthesis tyrosine autokinase [Candidatus Polarisedimenticolaceae bacterium]